MTVSKFTQPDMTTMDPAAYKAALDAAINAMSRMGAGFAPRAADTPDMTVTVDPGALFNRSTGGFTTAAGQVTAAIATPGAGTSKIVRVYVTEAGVVGKVEGAASASPVAPAYPTGVFPVCQVTVADTTTAITNAMITDERAFNTGYGVPRNAFLVTASSTFACPNGAKFLRITAAGGGGGGGGGYSAAADATKYGGGGGGGAGSVISRMFTPENLAIVIGAGGAGGANASAAATNDAVAGSAGGTTTITGAYSGSAISCAGGGGGGRAVSTPANGAAGTAGAAGTGVAGTAGVAGTSISGGNGGGTGTSATLSAGGKGAAWATTGRIGSPGSRGSGGGGGSGFQAGGLGGGNGGDGFVLIEVF
ncbi:hypothetical protein Dsui_0209 [Azospira oryzae PS]|uniref:Glycine-rich domain-containing protein n=1 Tax=Azospira oryzae (strain ATCC BAA-33 / DSM 13638 / PS) TaxID=640081 RepID=G8QMP9_AZOOP|nr:hypothetical protein [Azospira oryzae]AEV24629.1 hypothetical protein Dsui_0209 [Azospira oryzae PS]